MKLAEEGKIDLEDPVREYGVKIPNEPGINVKHLLTQWIVLSLASACAAAMEPEESKTGMTARRYVLDLGRCLI